MQNTAHKDHFTLSEVADMLSVSKETLRRWDKNGKLKAIRHPDSNYRFYHKKQLLPFDEAKLMFNSNWQAEMQTKAKRPFRSLELFAGAGGLALGLEMAGFEHIALNELMTDACATLQKNRPHWNVLPGDVENIDFNEYKHGVDLLSGGFPCQAFSYAGKKLGFADTRGTLFHQFARVVEEIRPKAFMAENVRGLLNHDGGKTLRTMRKVIGELGYDLIEPQFLKAIFYMVPQKRERLFLIGIRQDLRDTLQFQWPSPYTKILTLQDALKTGILYDCDCPDSPGQSYPKRKAEILSLVPPGGYWRDLPKELQKEYMKGSYHLEGGKTGMARRLSWNEPSLTLTCAPAQKQTERCHPDETRPLTTREYARIQTFPDDWEFVGSVSSVYKQIGNAVPVNLAWAMGRALIRMLNCTVD
ncbi:MAG: DNA (cytosine-5-)-methyltransferase [Lentisphaeria bacterium]|nr:DNA (cytosine-5-)-methyltransferase [Lentisphaeria bacterium]NLZ60915.1 DNA (cytosine-5-)-methyltransferase [Lentisphaerota bacterium]